MIISYPQELQNNSLLPVRAVSSLADLYFEDPFLTDRHVAQKGYLVTIIHSKSEPHDPNGSAKEIELSANLSKNAIKWPKNSQKLPKMVQI